MLLLQAARAVSIGDFARATRAQLQDELNVPALITELQRAGRRVVSGAREGVPGDTMWWFLELYLERLYAAFGAKAFELISAAEGTALENTLYAQRVALEAALQRYPFLPYVARLYRDAHTVEVLPEAQRALWLDGYFRKIPPELPRTPLPRERPSGVFRL